MLRKFIALFFLFLCLSCANEDQREEEIAAIPVEVELIRFDEIFAAAAPEDLRGLKKDFSYLFPSQFPDEVWVEKMQDTIQLEINREVAKEFPNLDQTKEELHSLFQHVKYYFPQENIPEVVTLTSEVDYRNKVIWEDDLLLISLDTYLGTDHHFYIGIQEYIKKTFEKEQIASDVADAFAQNQINRPTARTFLAHMIYYGKILYLNDLLIPFKTDAQKIGYTEAELNWARQNETQVWRYFVEKELLYDTNSELQSRFLFPGPFSKFYLELDADSPAKLGQYIGWQIVRQYMSKNDISVEDLIEAEAETIFNQSNYKPKK
ncbi:gliding motility lipoprotein GldB [Salinimicrobium sp. GXAS 041]|uniref:gliding motility lipoprotein GldB n=1 Tax=Salinimicrobium sp. GXAS 041 TaxID=3400806 RepID=UPI003C77756E